MGKLIAVVGDASDHGGTIITSNQDGSLTVNGIEVAVEGAQHDCPIHGTTSVSAVTIKTYHNGKLILTDGAIAECGAIIAPVNRNVFVE